MFIIFCWSFQRIIRIKPAEDKSWRWLVSLDMFPGAHNTRWIQRRAPGTIWTQPPKRDNEKNRQAVGFYEPWPPKDEMAKRQPTNEWQEWEMNHRSAASKLTKESMCWAVTYRQALTQRRAWMNACRSSSWRAAKRRLNPCNRETNRCRD